MAVQANQRHPYIHKESTDTEDEKKEDGGLTDFRE